jgi:hypothetical protein
MSLPRAERSVEIGGEQRVIGIAQMGEMSQKNAWNRQHPHFVYGQDRPYVAFAICGASFNARAAISSAVAS